jgi:hypothetical protein
MAAGESSNANRATSIHAQPSHLQASHRISSLRRQFIRRPSHGEVETSRQPCKLSSYSISPAWSLSSAPRTNTAGSRSLSRRSASYRHSPGCTGTAKVAQHNGDGIRLQACGQCHPGGRQCTCTYIPASSRQRINLAFNLSYHFRSSPFLSSHQAFSRHFAPVKETSE